MKILQRSGTRMAYSHSVSFVVEKLSVFAWLNTTGLYSRILLHICVAQVHPRTLLRYPFLEIAMSWLVVTNFKLSNAAGSTTRYSRVMASLGRRPGRRGPRRVDPRSRLQHCHHSSRSDMHFNTCRAQSGRSS